MKTLIETSSEVKCKGQGSLQVTGRCGIYFDSNTMYMHEGGLLFKFFMNWIPMPVKHGRETNHTEGYITHMDLTSVGILMVRY